MPCPSARVCGEPGARGGSARGAEPKRDQSRLGDGGSVRDRIEGLGLRAPLTHHGEEAEKQERRQVPSNWVRTVASGAAQWFARVSPARGGTGMRLAPGTTGHRAWVQNGRPGAKTPVPGGRGGPRRRAGSSSRGLVPPLPLARPGKRDLLPEERGSGFGVPCPTGRDSRGVAGPGTAWPAWPRPA